MINYLKDVSKSTPIGMLPDIMNFNNDSIESEFNNIYNSSLNRLTKSVYAPTGSVKAHFGEFVNLSAEYITVKNVDSLRNTIQSCVDDIIIENASEHYMLNGRFTNKDIQKDASEYSSRTQQLITHDAGTIYIQRITDSSDEYVGETLADTITDIDTTIQNLSTRVNDDNTSISEKIIKIDSSIIDLSAGLDYTYDYIEDISAKVADDISALSDHIKESHNEIVDISLRVADNSQYFKVINSSIENISLYTLQLASDISSCNPDFIRGYFKAGQNISINVIDINAIISAEGYIYDANGNLIQVIDENYQSKSNGAIYSFATGQNNIISGKYSHAEGQNTSVNGDFAHAEGMHTKANKNGSHAEGLNTIANGVGSHAEGLNTSTNDNYSHAEGAYTIASGEGSHAEGSYTIASGKSSHTEGENTQTIGLYSHAEGSSTNASGQGSHAEGSYTIASGKSSHTEGENTQTIGLYSHAEGNTTTASGYASHAEGSGTAASGEGSHAEGSGTTAYAEGSHAEGEYTTATGFASHAEGYKTNAIGNHSHAEGLNTIANGAYSHTEGEETSTYGFFSHAEGYKTNAIGNHSHAEGYKTNANGEGSHAEGQYTQTIGDYSHAEGQGTIAYGNGQHVEGAYNISTADNYYVIVGNGTSSSSRSNAMTVGSDGVVWAQTDVECLGSSAGAPLHKLSEKADASLLSYVGLKTYKSFEIGGEANDPISMSYSNTGSLSKRITTISASSTNIELCYTVNRNTKTTSKTYINIGYGTVTIYAGNQSLVLNGDNIQKLNNLISGS